MAAIQLILVVLLVSITMNEAQQRWGSGRWGRVNSFDSNNMLDYDSPTDQDTAAFLEMFDKLTSGNLKEQPTNRPQTQQQQRQATQAAPTTESSITEGPANPGTVIFMSPCSRCGVTQQYNPVCGSDNRTYANKRVLDCHRFCGQNVTLKRLGGCGANRS